MNTFRFSLAPEVVVGEGSSQNAGKLFKKLGCKKIVCVFDKGVKAAGILDPILKCVQDEGIEVVTYDGILPDPPDYTVIELAELGKREKVDGILAVGGGSTMDTSKAANLLMFNSDHALNEYHINYGLQKNPAGPIIAIPTTSGTGSEVSKTAIITNTLDGLRPRLGVGQKMSIMEQATRAVYALVDPLLTLGLPIHITIATALDALCHCVEAATTEDKYSNPFMDPLCFAGTKMIIENLPKVMENPKDLEARSYLSIAAMIGGFVAGNAYAHMAHAVGQGLQGVFHMAHGTGCAMGLQMAIECVSEVYPNKIKEIGKAMGIDEKAFAGLSPKEAGDLVSKKMGEFLTFLKSPTLKDLKIEKSELEKAIPYILTERAYPLGPVKPNGEEVMAYLLRIYDGY